MTFKAILICLIALTNLNAQTKTNFELISQLVNESVNDISGMNTSKDYTLEFVGADDYKIFKVKLIQALKSKNITIVKENKLSDKLTYSLGEIKIIYDNVFKDGIFGNYLVKRDAAIKGSYFLTNSGNMNDVIPFNYYVSDTVLYSDISKLDNIAYSFSTSELPEEPFFSSTIEPAIAIGTAAVAVYLFFNIRSR